MAKNVFWLYYALYLSMVLSLSSYHTGILCGLIAGKTHIKLCFGTL